MVSLGRQYDYFNETCLPLYGYIEMLITGNSYASNATLTVLKEKMTVFTLSKHYDNFGMMKLLSYTNDSAIAARIEYDYEKNNEKISTLISREKIITNNKTIDNEYSYYTDDKLKELKTSNVTYRKFEYNHLGYLTRDNYLLINKDFVYEYDDLGNILSNKVFNHNTSNLIKNNIYTYSSYFPTLLTSYNDKTIEYNDELFGNPTSYGNESGKRLFTWQGKKLIEVVDTSKNLNIEFKYDDKGLRIRKKSNNIETKYFYEGKNLVLEKTQNIEKYYYYDENDNLFGFGLKENNLVTNYYYIRDLNGVIIGMLDSNGNLVVEYCYDSFGNLLTISGSLADTIGIENNMLYKGYYFDFDLQMYYLKSRFYVPEWGRFLNSDDPRLLGAYSILTQNRNLFAYCNNDPIQNIDENGQFFKKIRQKIWKWLVNNFFVNISFTFSKKIDMGSGYIDLEETTPLVGNSWSLFSIDIGYSSGDWSLNFGIGGPLSINFGSDGVYLKGEMDIYKRTVEMSAGFADNNTLFIESGGYKEVSENCNLGFKIGYEININYDKLAYAFATICVYGVTIVIAGSGVVAAPYTGGASTVVTAAAVCVLLTMIANENNSGDNIL